MAPVTEQPKLNISKLSHREDGNYEIKINGEVFGFINAQTHAVFHLSGAVSGTLKAGTHMVVHRGRDLKVEVKDITPGTTFYDLDRTEPDYREERRIARLPYLQSEVVERVRRAKEHNEKTMKEILERVVVMEA